MCGLIGIAGNITFKEEKVFKTLLALDVIRGKHSTGFASLHGTLAKPEYSVVKDKYNAIDFMDSQPFTTLMAKKHWVLMGHNRHATQGAIVKENAHPFEFDNVIGAHNGSLLSGWKSAFHDSFNRVVDSEALYSEMNHTDAATTWPKVNGAAALTWMDKRDNTLHFLRNDQRPLFFTTLNKGETLIWASEPWMIHVATGREGLEIDKNPREVVINQHYTFPIELKAGQKITYTTEKVEAYVAPKWEPKSYPSYGNYSSRYDDYDDGSEWLTKEGVKLGEEVEFTVESINDRIDMGKQVAHVYGKTLAGTPIRMFSVDSLMYENLLLEMWEYEGMVFRGAVKYTTYTGLIIDVKTAECTKYTEQDIQAAEDKLKDEKAQLDKEIKLLAASLDGSDKKLH